MKKLILYIIFLNFAVSYSQQQAANWYFGDNAGIQFDTGADSINTLTDGLLNTDEGCTSISDDSGNLLFYTDGITVYDRQHRAMPRGNGLKGNPSSTQSAIIIPKPEDSDNYYIFTVDTEFQDTVDEGFHYSEVNMTLNGGFGDVTAVKNRNLLPNTSEKLSAVLQDCESGNIWVITFADNTGGENNNTFYAYEVSAAGVNTTPVISNAGIGINERRGYLKFSPDGTKLACANIGQGLFLFDFDTSTGIVSGRRQIDINFNSSSAQPQSPYGIEFSPSSEILYVTTYYETPFADFDNPGAQYGALLQYDISGALFTELVIDERQMYRSALQLGPDGKIYRSLSATYNSGTPFLSVIENPNIVGVGSNYQHAVIDLNGRNSRQGLPPFISSFFTEKIDITGDVSETSYLPLCDGETFTLFAEDFVGATYTWTLDGVLLPETDFDLEISVGGTYELIIDLDTADCETLEGEAIVEYFPNPTANDVTLIQCDEDGTVDGFTIFNLNQAEDDIIAGATDVSVKFHLTALDAQNDENDFDGSNFPNTVNPQTIYVQVIDDMSGCNSFSELILDVSTTQILDYAAAPACDEIDSEDGLSPFDLDIFTADIQAINGIAFPVTYYETYEDALLEQNQLATPYTNITPYSQTIYARAEDDNACYGISEVQLTVNPLPQLLEDETVFYCLNIFPETITLQSGVDGNPDDYTYLWSSGQTTHEIEINTVGPYTVTVTNVFGCSKQRTITVEPSNIATIDNVEIIDGQIYNSVTVLASGEGVYEYALYDSEGIIYIPFQFSNTFDNVYPGIYTLTVRDIKNDCGTVEQTISVIGFPQYFTPNNDGFHDTWQVLGVSTQFQPQTRIKIFNRFGKLLKELSPIGPGWDGTFNGKVLPNDDYWFSAELQDGRTFISHFSLKR